MNPVNEKKGSFKLYTGGGGGGGAGETKKIDPKTHTFKIIASKIYIMLMLFEVSGS